MIQILKAKDCARSLGAFATMFEDRKALFVDLLGWEVPVVDGRYEIDQFDDAHAVYVVALDHKGTPDRDPNGQQRKADFPGRQG